MGNASLRSLLPRLHLSRGGGGEAGWGRLVYEKKCKEVRAMVVRLRKRNAEKSYRKVIAVNNYVLTGKQFEVLKAVIKSLRESSQLDFWRLDRTCYILENGKYVMKIETKLTKDEEFIAVILLRHLVFPRIPKPEISMLGMEEEMVEYAALKLLDWSETIAVRRKGDSSEEEILNLRSLPYEEMKALVSST